MLRRDLLPDCYSLDTIYSMTSEQFAHEMNTQLDMLENECESDPYIAIYDGYDLEDLINLDENNTFSPKNYYIRYFEND